MEAGVWAMLGWVCTQYLLLCEAVHVYSVCIIDKPGVYST
jgi:hypothetical protein